jgi:hypothetical protein
MMLLRIGMGLALVAELAIILKLAPPALLWPLLGITFSLGNIAYSQLSSAFAVSMSGRVNTALNLVVFVGAFSLQWGIGAAVDAFGAAGMSRPEAFQSTLGALLILQTLAFLWFLMPLKWGRRSVGA